MLYIVLLLVAAALAGVVAALITAESLWAWISIGLSVLAGLLLLVDWFRRRSKGTAAEPSPQSAADAEDGVEDEQAETEASTENDAEAAAAAHDGAGTEAEEGTADTAEGAPEEAEAATEAERSEPAGETAGSDDIPGEEDTDAADLLIVSELESEVLVVDEYPRYHLGECDWLTNRETLPLPISEARELGFSPCALCGPDAALAAKHREGRRKFRSHTEG